MHIYIISIRVLTDGLDQFFVNGYHTTYHSIHYMKWYYYRTWLSSLTKMYMRCCSRSNVIYSNVISDSTLSLV